MKGLGVRIFRAYQSVGVATSLSQLVGLNSVGDKKKACMLVPVVAKTNNVVKPTELVLTKDKKLKEFVVNVLLPVVPSTVQKYFSYNYTMNQIIAVYRKGIQVGEERAKNPLGKWLMPLLIILIVVGIVVIGGAMLLG